MNGRNGWTGWTGWNGAEPATNVGLPDSSSADHRYAEGQRIYFRESDPKAAASVVIDNANLAAPRIVGSNA